MDLVSLGSIPADMNSCKHDSVLHLASLHPFLADSSKFDCCFCLVPPLAADLCYCMLSSEAAYLHQPVAAHGASLTPVALTAGTSQHVSPALPGHNGKGKESGRHAHEEVALQRKTSSGPRGPAAGSKRKADELQQDGQLEVKLLSAIALNHVCQGCLM